METPENRPTPAPPDEPPGKDRAALVMTLVMVALLALTICAQFISP